MLALLVLSVVAAASAIPIEKKILPIYENPQLYQSTDADMVLRSWCVDDCHLHVLQKPVFILKKGIDHPWEINYFPLGLNSLGKSPLSMPIKEYIMTGDKVAMLIPLAKFPWSLFPGVSDLDIITPEHMHKFNSFYKQAPVMVILTEEEFKEFNKNKGYTHLADLAIDDLGIHMYKDYAQYRSIPHVNSNSPTYPWRMIHGRAYWTPETPVTAPLTAPVTVPLTAPLNPTSYYTPDLYRHNVPVLVSNPVYTPTF